MASLWDAVDPDDITDLFIDLGAAEKPFLPVDREITAQTVTVPDEVVLVDDDWDGKVSRVQVGPCQPGKWPIHYHLELDDGQVRDFDVFLPVRERIVKAKQ